MTALTQMEQKIQQLHYWQPFSYSFGVFSQLSLHPLLAWLSPLPCSSGHIPPMPAGHSSLHFFHSDQRCPWITTEPFKKSPCSIVDLFYTYMYCTRVHTSVVVSCLVSLKWLLFVFCQNFLNKTSSHPSYHILLLTNIQKKSFKNMLHQAVKTILSVPHVRNNAITSEYHHSTYPAQKTAPHLSTHL